MHQVVLVWVQNTVLQLYIVLILYIIGKNWKPLSNIKDTNFKWTEQWIQFYKIVRF